MYSKPSIIILSDYESSYKQKKRCNTFILGLNHLKLQSLAKRVDNVALHKVFVPIIMQDVMRCTMRLPSDVRQCWSLGGTEKIILEFNNVLEEEGERKALVLVI